MTSAEPVRDLYRSFLSVRQEGSLSGTARALGLTQPTVGRHIDALEQTLGLSLFTRSQAGFIATDAAHALQPCAETLASASSALLRAAAGIGRGEDAQIKGAVRVTASEVVGVEVLPPVLARLRETHPGVTLNWRYRTASKTCCAVTPTLRAHATPAAGRAGGAPHRQYRSRFSRAPQLSGTPRHAAHLGGTGAARADRH